MSLTPWPGSQHWYVSTYGVRAQFTPLVYHQWFLPSNSKGRIAEQSWGAKRAAKRDLRKLFNPPRKKDRSIEFDLHL